MLNYTVEIKGNNRVKIFKIDAVNTYKAYLTACKMVKLPENSDFSYTNSIHCGVVLVYCYKRGFIRSKNA
jgi:hypothetical protein